ncbi:MAG: NAD(P)H-quinone oxidoreductase subunit F [Microcoleaceae cyanobacterium]
MTDSFLLQTCWLIPFYGLFGAVLALPWATGVIYRTGPRPAAYFNLLMTLVAVIHGSIIFRFTWSHPPIQLTYLWLQATDLNLPFVIEISPVSMGAVELVTGLGFLAQLYALGYMEKDWGMARFFALMGFFEAAISGIALSDSLFLTYALLEMLTLSTYLLVGFWYAQPLVVTAARDAFLTMRGGDVLLLMGVVGLAALSGSLGFSDLKTWSETANLSPLVANCLGLALIAGPIGKCALFPLNLWLDEAMEGPNPASILRNSVVVAGGAYVLIKLEPVLELSPVTDGTLIVLGAATAIGASLVAFAQIDIKRALSHSTSAYLGLVFIAVGLKQVDAALLLLLTHSIAKSLLFMGIGSVILTTNTQDLTEMGGLKSRMPATTTAFVIGSAGMVALLPLGTFWSFQHWVTEFQRVPLWLMLVLCLVNGLTALNLTRMYGLIFAGQTQPKTRRAPEVAWPMAVPLVSLIIVTLLVPFILERWQLLLSVRDSLTSVSSSQLTVMVDPLMIPLVASGLVGTAVGVSIYLYGTVEKPVKLPWKVLQNLLAYDFYVEQFYDVTVVFLVSRISKLSAWIDRYVIDGVANAFGLGTIFGGESLKYSVSGQSQFYVLTIALGVALLIAATIWQFS